MKFCLISLGCPKNLTDSEELAGELLKTGWEHVFSEDGADAVLLNTCGFIKPAVAEAEGEIRRLLKLKAAGKIKKLAVAGCLVERRREALVKKFPGVDVFCGIACAQRLPELLRKNKTLIAPVPLTLAAPAHKMRLTLAHSAYLKIADGCDNRCAYCTIPAIRGRYRSKPEEHVLAEARLLAQSGAKEISLVAQDTTSYGTDIYGKPRLPELLRKLARVKGIKWLRIMYAYPEKISPELLRVMAGEEKICKYLDVPLQHISDPVLKAMNRRSGEKLIREKLELMRKTVPGIAIRTNFITGFPGETDRDFAKLAAFVKTAKFDSLGVFTYCKEAGTPAARFANQVPEKIKQERADAVVQIQSRVVDGLNRKLTGRTVNILADDTTCGRTESSAPEIDGRVIVENGGLKPGEFARVKIISALGYERKAVMARDNR